MSDNSPLLPTIQNSGEGKEEEKRTQNQTSGIYNSDNQGDINAVNENKETNNHTEYKKTITSDGRIVRVLLSDGEISPGLDSVSSVDDVASDYTNASPKNVLVEVRNEFALQHSEGEVLETSKKVDLHQQDFTNGFQVNGDKMYVVDSPPNTDTLFHEKTDKSRNSSEPQQLNYKGSKRDELRASSNRSDERSNERSDERVSRRSRGVRRSRSSGRQPSERLNSPRRSRSKTRDRRRLSSQERRSKNSRRRSSRSLSRGRSRDLTRRRSRNSSRRRSRSPNRRSSSLSKTRKSRSLSRRRSRSLTKKSSCKKKSKSPEKVSSTSYETRETGVGDRSSSISYYSVTEARRGREAKNFGFHATTIQVSGYFPPAYDSSYHWRSVNRGPRGFVRGVFYPSIKRPYTNTYAEDSTPAPKIPRRPYVEYTKSVSPDNNSKDDFSKTETKQDQTESSSEVSSRSSAEKGNVFTDTENIPLPKVADSTGCGSSEVSQYHSPLPTVGLDNQPLVRGPTGLPVHISPTGVTIPYDMDGRRVPIGPNGQYLPLDASGRLFPHVITVENNVMPIYISEDGVLRLPDAQPVPFGSPHKAPVNIDGKIILIGPDSRPVVPCPNIPARPPVYFNQVKNVISPCKITPITEMESPQSELNQVVHSTGIEVNLDMTNDLDENKNIDYKSNKRDSSNATHTKPLELESTANPLSDICIGPNLKQILDSVDENLLRKVQELTQQSKVIKWKRTPREDPVVVQIRSVIKTLTESNYEPPQYGRFILPEVLFKPPNVDNKTLSPLWRNRIKIPFITREAEESIPDTPESPESNITYTFVSTGNFNVFKETTANEAEMNVGEDSLGMGKDQNKPQTAEFGVQCDFTTDIISEYNSTVSKLRKEIMSLQNGYSILLEMYERASVCKEME